MTDTLLLPNFGDLVSLQEFIEWCKSGYVDDDAGSGYYSDGRVYWRDLPAKPSDIKKDRIKHSLNYRYVIWFNE
jgi:hypothetical protein